MLASGPGGSGTLISGSSHRTSESGSAGPLEPCHPWKLGCTEEAIGHHIQGATEMPFLGVPSLGVSKLQPSVTCSGQLILRAPQCSDRGIPQPQVWNGVQERQRGLCGNRGPKEADGPAGPASPGTDPRTELTPVPSSRAKCPQGGSGRLSTAATRNLEPGSPGASWAQVCPVEPP